MASLDAIQRRLKTTSGTPYNASDPTPAAPLQTMGGAGPSLGDMAQKPLAYGAGQSAAPSEQNGYQAKTAGYNDIPNWQYQGVNDFDFNQGYAQQKDALGRNLADAGQKYDLANQQDAEGYQRSLRDLQNQSQGAFDSNAERLAGNGILHSGVAVEAAGGIGNDLQSRIDSLTRQRTEGSTARETDYGKYQQQINDMLSSYQNDATQRQQQIEQQRAQEAAQAQAAQQAAAASQAAIPAYNPGGSFGGPQQQPQNMVSSLTQNGSGIFFDPMSQEQAQQQYGMGPGYQFGNTAAPVGDGGGVYTPPDAGPPPGIDFAAIARRLGIG